MSAERFGRFDWKTEKVVKDNQPELIEVADLSVVPKLEEEGYHLVTDSELFAGGEFDYGK